MLFAIAILCFVLALLAVGLFVVLFRDLDLILLLVTVVSGGQKWGSENREKWSSGMGVLQN